MNKEKKTSKLTLALMILGILLIVAAAAAVSVSAVIGNKAARDAYTTANRLFSLMPEVKNAAADDRIDMTMPTVSIDGADFCGVVEIPKYNATLPVYASWNKARLSLYPCRYMGSIYDGSLVIGGGDAAGQFDFMKSISSSDTVYVTDMTGMRYSYSIRDVKLTDDASTDTLTEDGAELVLFARNSYGGGYTVVLCDR